MALCEYELQRLANIASNHEAVLDQLGLGGDNSLKKPRSPSLSESPNPKRESDDDDEDKPAKPARNQGLCAEACETSRNLAKPRETARYHRETIRETSAKPQRETARYHPQNRREALRYQRETIAKPYGVDRCGRYRPATLDISLSLRSRREDAPTLSQVTEATESERMDVALVTGLPYHLTSDTLSALPCTQHMRDAAQPGATA